MKTSLKNFFAKDLHFECRKKQTLLLQIKIFLMVFPWSNRKFLEQNFLFLEEKKKDKFFV